MEKDEEKTVKLENDQEKKHRRDKGRDTRRSEADKKITKRKGQGR